MHNCNLIDALHDCSGYLGKYAFSPESNYWLSNMINMSNSFLYFKSSLHFTTVNDWENGYSQTPFYRMLRLLSWVAKKTKQKNTHQKNTCDSILVTRTFIFLTQNNATFSADVCVYYLCIRQVCIFLFCVQSFKNSRKIVSIFFSIWI